MNYSVNIFSFVLFFHSKYKKNYHILVTFFLIDLDLTIIALLLVSIFYFRNPQKKIILTQYLSNYTFKVLDIEKKKKKKENRNNGDAISAKLGLISKYVTNIW